MRKIYLFLLLMNICGNTSAGWVYVAKTNNNMKEKDSFIAYANPVSIRKENNNVKIWSLYDYKESQPQGIKSVRQKSEYNCIEKKHRQLFLSAYSGKMNNGNIILIYNRPDDKWERVILGSVRMAMLKFACGWHPKLPPRKIPRISVVKITQ